MALAAGNLKPEAIRATVSTRSRTDAAASGGSVSPETSATTSWLALNDQFHSQKSPAVTAETTSTGLRDTPEP